jgi:hypothetical protein
MIVFGNRWNRPKLLAMMRSRRLIGTKDSMDVEYSGEGATLREIAWSRTTQIEI